MAGTQSAIMGTQQIHELRFGKTLFTHILATHMYGVVPSLWELIKNGWDAGVRKQRQPGQKPFEIKISLKFLSEHTLCGEAGGKTLVIIDNGEGLTEAALERYIFVGTNDSEFHTTAMMDSKRIGRIAAFALLKNKDQGYWVFSATSAENEVRMIHVIPEQLAERRLVSSFVRRDDTSLYGLAPQGTFTMIVLPNVEKSVQNVSNIVDELQWRIPRRECKEGFSLFVDGKPVEPAPLAKEQVIEKKEIIGYFEKSPATRGKQRGIRICDARTSTVVAEATKMASDMPWPFANPELTGDIFIGGLAQNQSTDRTGLSPNFLSSDEWNRIQEILLDNFSPILAKMLGDEGLIKTDALGRAVTNIVHGMNKVWGVPEKLKPPKGLVPPPGFPDVTQNEDKDSDPPSHDPAKTGDKKKDKHQRLKRINFEGQTYFLGLGRSEPDVAAILSSGNVIFINSQHPAIERFKAAPAALQMHILRAIVSAVKCVDQDLRIDAKSFDKSVGTAMNFFYAEADRNK